MARKLDFTEPRLEQCTWWFWRKWRKVWYCWDGVLVFPVLVFQLSKQQNHTGATSSTVLGTPPNPTRSRKFPLDELWGGCLVSQVPKWESTKKWGLSQLGTVRESVLGHRLNFRCPQEGLCPSDRWNQRKWRTRWVSPRQNPRLPKAPFWQPRIFLLLPWSPSISRKSWSQEMSQEVLHTSQGPHFTTPWWLPSDGQKVMATRNEK